MKTQIEILKPRTSDRSRARLRGVIPSIFVAVFGVVATASAQTIIPGGNISGTWPPSGNPYIITDNATVASGQTLTIQPGVVVMVGAGVSITANGVIQAVGTPSQRITFQAPVSSEVWNTISVNGTTDTNRFKYCDFQNANIALAFYNNTVNEVTYSTFQNVTNGITITANTGNSTVAAMVDNCVFSNCLAQAVYGVANGNAGCCWWSQNGTIIPVIRNCYFNSVGWGCRFFIQSLSSYGGGGYASPNVIGNIFCNVTNTAISMEVGSTGAGSSQATLVNNIVVNCATGVSATDPWDALVENNIIVGCTNAVTDSGSGSLSRAVGYNCFYGNATNFTGYNVNYGKLIWPNHNGTNSDIYYNFIQDPLFVGANDFHLQTSSPCIDAGNPGGAYLDTTFPPSQGTTINDIGIYGGPYAGNWIGNAYAGTTNFMLTAQQFVGITINPNVAGHYRLDYTSDLVNGPWTQATNLVLSTAPFTWIDYQSPGIGYRFFRAVKLP